MYIMYTGLIIRGVDGGGGGGDEEVHENISTPPSPRTSNTRPSSLSFLEEKRMGDDTLTWTLLCIFAKKILGVRKKNQYANRAKGYFMW